MGNTITPNGVTHGSASNQHLTQNPCTKERNLISDLYKLAQLDEVVLTQFDDILTKAHEEFHHKLEALDHCIEEPRTIWSSVERLPIIYHLGLWTWSQ